MGIRKAISKLAVYLFFIVTWGYFIFDDVDAPLLAVISIYCLYVLLVFEKLNPVCRLSFNFFAVLFVFVILVVEKLSDVKTILYVGMAVSSVIQIIIYQFLSNKSKV